MIWAYGTYTVNSSGFMKIKTKTKQQVDLFLFLGSC